tara:strand:- start:2811 stop:3266 length:456 start_codon:yes stop_codon:yes gene_type:complete
MTFNQRRYLTLVPLAATFICAINFYFELRLFGNWDKAAFSISLAILVIYIIRFAPSIDALERFRKHRDAPPIIADILKRRGSPLYEQVAETDDIRRLPESIRRQIGDLLTVEMAEQGFDASCNPTSYGLELEELIDLCAWEAHSKGARNSK